jgi:hypothetical protein
MVFSTGGDWDSTTLHNNGREVSAAQLFVELISGRDDFGNPRGGGINNGGEITAIVRPQEDPNQEIGIFPGRLEMNFPGHSIVIENNHPGFAFEFTRVWHNGVDITNQVTDIYVDVNAVDNVVRAYVQIYRDRFFGRDEVITYNII